MIEWWGRDNFYYPPKETIMIWHSNNGKSYRIEEMDTGHIQNCIIAVSKRIEDCKLMNLGTFQIHGSYGSVWIDAFKNELKLRRIIADTNYCTRWY